MKNWFGRKNALNDPLWGKWKALCQNRSRSLLSNYFQLKSSENSVKS